MKNIKADRIYLAVCMKKEILEARIKCRTRAEYDSKKQEIRDKYRLILENVANFYRLGLKEVYSLMDIVERL